jgi:hypothetical protein
VSCMVQEICNSLTEAEWQPCAYSEYRRLMEQEIRHLYACFHGLEEEKAPARTQRRAKAWLAGAHEDVERARDHIGLHLRKLTKGGGNERRKVVPGLVLPHGCQHRGLPEGSRPCREHAEQAVQWARQAMGAEPTRFQEAVEGVPEKAGRAIHIRTLAAGGRDQLQETQGAASELLSDLDPVSKKEQDTVTPSEEEAILPSAPPMEEEESHLEETIAGLRGRALHQVRQYVAILAKMRKNLTPSTRARLIEVLGWHLGPAHETGGANPREYEPEPAWLLHGTG